MDFSGLFFLAANGCLSMLILSHSDLRVHTARFGCATFEIWVLMVPSIEVPSDFGIA